MNTQEIIAFLILLASVYYLYYKFFGAKKSKKNCNGNDCGCS